MYNESNGHVNQYLADEIAIYNMMKSLDGTVNFSYEERELIDKALKLHILENAKRIIKKIEPEKKHILK